MPIRAARFYSGELPRKRSNGQLPDLPAVLDLADPVALLLACAANEQCDIDTASRAATKYGPGGTNVRARREAIRASPQQLSLVGGVLPLARGRGQPVLHGNLDGVEATGRARRHAGPPYSARPLSAYLYDYTWAQGKKSGCWMARVLLSV
jgi:hypothetical protein